MEAMELAVVGLTGSGIGTALGVPMLWPRSDRTRGVRLMGGWLLALSAVAAGISARVIGLLPSSPPVDHVINLLGFTAYPLFYLYIREQAQPASRLRGTWWLWVPAMGYALVIGGRSAAGESTRVPFAWILPIALAFTVLCASLLPRVRAARTGGMVPARWTVGFLALLNVAQIVRMLFAHVAPVRALVPLVATAGFVTMVALLVWNASEPRRVAAGPARQRYEKSGLDRDAAMALIARIERALAGGRLFADPTLTLARLAAAAECTPHQVSEVLNRYGETNFHELLNRRRVADVKRQLLDPAAHRYTIEGIGASAGFGSRSALYAAFRRLEGITPAEFRARGSSGAEFPGS